MDALEKKLLEEVHEFLSARDNDENAQYELADILEVIDAICVARKFSKENIFDKKLKKKDENGGFEKRFFLVQKD